jgi:hypothetical protein
MTHRATDPSSRLQERPYVNPHGILPPFSKPFFTLIFTIYSQFPIPSCRLVRPHLSAGSFHSDLEHRNKSPKIFFCMNIFTGHAPHAVSIKVGTPIDLHLHNPTGLDALDVPSDVLRAGAQITVLVTSLLYSLITFSIYPRCFLAP